MAAQHSAPAAASSISQLPEAALERILGRVPQQERLTSAALVCSAWAAAATATTTDVVLTIKKTDQKKHSKQAALQAWLDEHAAQLTSISNGDTPQRAALTLHLPLRRMAQLQHLCMWGCRLQWQDSAIDSAQCAGGSSGSGGGGGGSTQLDAPAAPALFGRLQTLRLYSCELEGFVGALAQLQVSQLTRLALFDSTRYQQADEARAQQVTAAAAALLPRLPQLSSLQLLLKAPLDGTTLRSLSTMQRLEWCHLSGGVASSALTLLCSTGLTDLTLQCASEEDRSTLFASLPEHGWPALQRLELSYVALCPDILRKLPRLNDLELRSVYLAPPGTTQVPDDAWEDADDQADNCCNSPAGVSALLSALAQLTGLSRLWLGDLRLDLAEPQQCSSLTASEGLRMLHVSSSYEQTLPPQALQRMFPAEQDFTAELTHLDLQGNDSSPWCVSAADVDRIADACPDLTDLSLAGVMSPGPEALGSLLQLQQQLEVTSLCLGGAYISNAAAATIARMTQLRELVLLHVLSFADVGLQQLTALRSLKMLRVWDSGLSPELLENGWVLLHNKAKEGDQPDVWSQLECLLEASTVPTVSRVRDLSSRLQQAQAELQQAQAELERERARNADLQRQVDEAVRKAGECRRQVERPAAGLGSRPS